MSSRRTPGPITTSLVAAKPSAPFINREAAAYGSRLARSLSSGARSRDPLAWPGRRIFTVVRKSPSRCGHGWRRAGSRWRNRRSCPSTDSSARCARRSSRSAQNAAPALVDRRNAHQAGNRQAVSVATARKEAVRLGRRNARLLRFLAGVELDEQFRSPFLGIDFLG